MKYVLLTNVPSPYRAKQYDEIASIVGDHFVVVYTSTKYSNTQMKWEKPILRHNYQFIDNYSSKLLPSVLKVLFFLRKANPQIIITSGFKMIMLFSFFFAKTIGCKHVVFTDSWLHSVNKLSILHKIIRRIVFKFSDGFICVGEKGHQYLKTFGANPRLIFISRLSDTIPDSVPDINTREYDLIFSGQFIENKQPFFFIEVAREVTLVRPQTKVLIIGAGPLENGMRSKLGEYRINYRFDGYVNPNEVKRIYSCAKILLFPTLDDAWGMVANDAFSCGLTVISSPYAGAAGDLIIDGVNGFVMDLDYRLWAEKIVNVLNDSKNLNKLSLNAIEHIKHYSVEQSALDFVNALKFVERNNG